MRRLLVSLTAASLISPAKFAVAGPVCLAGGEDNALLCDYANLNQCRATASGGLGYCVRNPAYKVYAHASYGYSVSITRRPTASPIRSQNQGIGYRSYEPVSGAFKGNDGQRRDNRDKK